MTKRELNFDLKQLRSFLEVIQENSFTKASRKLHIGQATISHHIQQLEEMLGVSLINRSSKSFSVTGQGEQLKEFCIDHFNKIEKLTSEMASEHFIRPVKIAVSTIPSTCILPEIIADIRLEHPDFFYRVFVSDSREAVEMLKEGSVDLAVTGARLINPMIEYEAFFTDELVLAGPAEYKKNIKIEELRAIPLVSREQGSGSRNAVERYLSERGIHPSGLNIVYECSTSNAIKEAIAAGIGCGFISSLAIKKEISDNRLTVINIHNFKIKREFFLATGKNRALPNPALILIKALREAGEKQSLS